MYDSILSCLYAFLAPVSAPSLSKHQVNYVCSHKGPCLTAAFSHDGKLAASGSADFSIKVGTFLYFYHAQNDLMEHAQW